MPTRQAFHAHAYNNHRSRAHCNPLSHNDAFDYPNHPSKMDWSALYPNIENPVVRFLDVGCGFGGLTGEMTYY